jgi:hypothetical protein
MQLPIVNILNVSPDAPLELVAAAQAFNFGFSLVLTVGVILLPLVLAIRLVQRS